MNAAADLALAYQSQGKLPRKIGNDSARRVCWGPAWAGRKKYAEAEPLLLAGYQGMAAQKARMLVADLYHLDRARDWIVQRYEAWGKPANAAEWRSK